MDVETVERVVDSRIRTALAVYEAERERRRDDLLWIVIGVINWTMAAVVIAAVIFAVDKF